MLDFCAVKNVLADVELIRVDQVNEAYERLVKNEVRYRFVIDMSTLWIHMHEICFVGTANAASSGKQYMI